MKTYNQFINETFKKGDKIKYEAEVDGDIIHDKIIDIDKNNYFIGQGWLFSNSEEIEKNKKYKISKEKGNKLFKSV